MSWSGWVPPTESQRAERGGRRGQPGRKGASASAVPRTPGWVSGACRRWDKAASAGGDTLECAAGPWHPRALSLEPRAAEQIYPLTPVREFPKSESPPGRHSALLKPWTPLYGKEGGRQQASAGDPGRHPREPSPALPPGKLLAFRFPAATAGSRTGSLFHGEGHPPRGASRAGAGRL